MGLGWIGWIRGQPWRITIAAVGGLLVAIFVAGLVGLLVNLSVENVTDEARYDLDLEDEGTIYALRSSTCATTTAT